MKYPLEHVLSFNSNIFTSKNQTYLAFWSTGKDLIETGANKLPYCAFVPKQSI